MEKENFISLLSNPVNIDFRQIHQLENILEEYPFFQSAQVLRLKGLKNQNSFLYNPALKKTAAYTADRSILFDFIVSEEFAQNEVAKKINRQSEESKKPKKTNEDLNKALRMQLHEAHQILDPGLFQGKQIPEPSPEEKELEIGKPLNFDKSESHSFSEWLKLTSVKPINRKSEKEEKDSRHHGNLQSRKSKLIDDFITKNPRISPAEKPAEKNQPIPTTNFPDKLMTETLARVYLEQKNYKKAIQAYKILILKNPEKSGFFADQIRAIEKLQENNTQ